MIDILVKMGYVSHYTPTGSIGGSGDNLLITAKGWEKVSSLKNEKSIGAEQAFVAMWFHDKMKPIFDNAIRPAIEENKLQAFRMDKKEHNEKICDEIISEIRRSKYLVADFTGSRGGVYYEAGYAHGIGIPVIFMVSESGVDDLHFDTRQYNHIIYKDAVDLKIRLSNRIRATIV